MRTRPPAHTHAYARAQTNTDAYTHERTHTHAHAHARTHTDKNARAPTQAHVRTRMHIFRQNLREIRAKCGRPRQAPTGFAMIALLRTV